MKLLLALLFGFGTIALFVNASNCFDGTPMGTAKGIGFAFAAIIALLCTGAVARG